MVTLTRGLASVVVNDALRNPTMPQRVAELDPSFRNKIVGLAAQAESEDPAQPFDPPGLFAANAYDCVNLIALAAVRSDSDSPREISSQMASVSSSGSVCRSFVECAGSIQAGLQVDYDGPAGLTDISARGGDPSRAVFDRFVYGPDGRDSVQGTVIVGS